MTNVQRLLKLALVTSTMACALVLLAMPPFRTSARQAVGRGADLVFIKGEDGREVQLYEGSYALVIGVGDYTQGWPALPGVKNDIEEVARALERHGFLVTKVENPDSAQLDKSLKEFISAHGRGGGNRLLFYFAGHGQTVKQSYGEEMGYVVPADAPTPTRDLNGFLDKALNMRQVERYAEDIQAKHALFLFDSCFSGALFALARAVPDAITYKTARPVRQFITSGSADEQVPDRSIFRRQFVEALDGEADANRDGYVTGTELGEFLQNKVINYSRNTQHPQYGKIRNPNLDKGDFVFALPKAPKQPTVASASPTPARPASPAPVDQTAVELAFWDTIKTSSNPEDFKAYLQEYPNGRFASLAKLRAQPAATKSTDGRVSPPLANKPVDNPSSYDDLIDRANSSYATEDFNGAYRYAQQAAQLDPTRPTAYSILGIIALYYSQNVLTAEQAMRAAIERGGAAVFRVQHDHSSGVFSEYCEGSFFVTKTSVSFKANNGRDTFIAEDSNIREAKVNRTVGPEYGAFHIKPVQAINGRNNFNFAPNTRNKTESDLIIRLVNAY